MTTKHKDDVEQVLADFLHNDGHYLVRDESLKTAKQAILKIVEEVIGEDEAGHTTGPQKRNTLRAKQRKRLKELNG